MSAGIEVAAAADGGIARAAMRQFLTNESFLFARYSAVFHQAWVALAPRFPGDIEILHIGEGSEMNVTAGALLGYETSVDASGRFGSLSQVLLREGMTVLRLSGEGQAVVSAYGAIQRFDVAPGQKMIVDTGHLVAWSASMQVRVGPLSGVVSSATTGEGLVGELTGPGTVLIQTRSESQFRSWLMPQSGTR